MISAKQARELANYPRESAKSNQDEVVFHLNEIEKYIKELAPKLDYLIYGIPHNVSTVTKNTIITNLKNSGYKVESMEDCLVGSVYKIDWSE